VRRFLEVCQLLLGQLALAVVLHNQLLVLQDNVLHGAPGGQSCFEDLDAVGEDHIPVRSVAGIARVVMVGYLLGVMLARKVEGWAMLICQERHVARPYRHAGRSFSAVVVVVAAGIAMAVVAPQRHGGIEHGRQWGCRL
jgi:hypothetical protein